MNAVNTDECQYGHTLRLHAVSAKISYFFKVYRNFFTSAKYIFIDILIIWCCNFTALIVPVFIYCYDFLEGHCHKYHLKKFKIPKIYLNMESYK